MRPNLICSAALSAPHHAEHLPACIQSMTGLFADASRSGLQRKFKLTRQEAHTAEILASAQEREMDRAAVIQRLSTTPASFKVVLHHTLKKLGPVGKGIRSVYNGPILVPPSAQSAIKETLKEFDAMKRDVCRLIGSASLCVSEDWLSNKPPAELRAIYAHLLHYIRKDPDALDIPFADNQPASIRIVAGAYLAALERAPAGHHEPVLLPKNLLTAAFFPPHVDTPSENVEKYVDSNLRHFRRACGISQADHQPMHGVILIEPQAIDVLARRSSHAVKGRQPA